MPDQGPARPGGGMEPTTAVPVFFAGAGRGTHLEQLRHLSQWSRRVLVVTGPRGIGKSTLYRQLCTSLEPRTKAARINGALANGAREVLNAMTQGFGLAAPADAGTQLLSEIIAGHAQEQDQSERYCVALIDDAETLDARAVDVLVNLAATTPLRVVLFGEVRLVSGVERAARNSAGSWHEIRLNAFDTVDVRDYLDWRFRQQGYTNGLPFTDANVKEIARVSEGLPGRIDRMANVLLEKIQVSGQEARARRFPALHRALLAVLVIAIGFAYVVWQPPGGGDDLAQVEQLEVPPVRPDPATSADDNGAPPEEVRAPDVRQDPVVIPREEGPSPAELRRSVEDAPAQEVEDAPARVDERAATAEDPDAPEDEPPTPEAMPASEPDEQPDKLSDPEDAAWIMGRPTTAYTLQLVTFSTAERASAYLARQAKSERFAHFRQQRNGAIQHVVIYGEFGSRADAEQAAARLPESVGNVQPWIRTFGEVQTAVRTALQR